MTIFTRVLGAALSATLLLAAAPIAQATSAGSADAQYVALAQTYYMESFKRNPIEATFAGLHTYDGEMGDFSAAAIQRELGIDREYLAKLAAIDRTQLSQ